MQFARPLADLIAQLERLPGVGPKSAQRLAFYVKSHIKVNGAGG